MPRTSKKSQAKVASTRQVWQDAKNSLLFVSLFINAFILVGWMVLKLTTQYDASLASALLGR